MKRLLFTISLAAICFISCDKNIEEVVKEDAPQTYTFTATANVADDLTKTTYDSDVTFKWSANDEISVLFHKGEDHKFFTLKTTVGGTSSADFSGTIEAGYEVGASATEGGIHWALFPAADHSWDYVNHQPVFHIPAETDYTESHFSANIPMRAFGDGENAFAFYTICGAYKFKFTGITVSKVKLVVEEIGGYSRVLSGDMPVIESGSSTYMETKTSYGASGSTTISFIEDVSSGEAVFYVPSRAWRNEFKPKITLLNMDEGSSKGFIIKTSTAKASLGNLANLNSLIVVPSVEASGSGAPFISSLGIDWSDGGIQTATGTNGVICAKATSDASYLYLYFEVDRSVLYDEDYDYANRFEAYIGSDSGSTLSGYWGDFTYSKNFQIWLLRNNVPNLISYVASPSICAENSSATSSEVNGHCYFDMKIPRSVDAGLQGTTAKLGFDLNKKWSNGGSSGGSYDHLGYVPDRYGDCWSVTMETYVP